MVPAEFDLIKVAGQMLATHIVEHAPFDSLQNGAEGLGLIFNLLPGIFLAQMVDRLMGRIASSGMAV